MSQTYRKGQKKMKNALIVCTVGCFLGFELNDISILQDMGYTVHVATNFNGYDEMHAKIKEMNVVIYQTDFARSPFSKQTINAYRQLKKIMREKYFDLIHCHTPVGGVLTRLSANKYRKKGTKVIYTAHGFHFYNGAPLKNWIIFYPIERWLSRYTDILITINTEDYERAGKKFHMKHLKYIPGVGVDTNKFVFENSSNNLRKELNIPSNAVWLLSVGELNANKNHELIIRTVKDIKNVYYTIAGKGTLEEHLRNVIQSLQLEDRVKLLGFCNDIAAYYSECDIYVHPSFREGLSVALMEAMASGLPCVVSDIRGNRDLIDENGGCLINPFSRDDVNVKLKLLIKDLKAGKDFAGYNRMKIQKFEVSNVGKIMYSIYRGDENESLTPS
ncbi:MAG: glycosyltransferase family 4 protein [Clostridium sp.]|nr:glycosyltransferase family 4 protein [Clostridium sp.]